MVTKENRLKNIRNMQTKILEQCMTPKEYAELLEKYHESKGSNGSGARTKFLNRVVTPSEVEVLRQYFKFASQSHLSKIVESKITRDGIARIALRWIYQRQLEGLQTEEEVKGGELKEDVK